MCHELALGHLLFESLDGDSMDRSVQPVYIQEPEGGINNKLNSYMDHVWDGFYTGQKRESKFPSIIEGSRGRIYNATFTGTPPNNMRFSMHATKHSWGATIRIHYPSAQSRNLVKDGKIIEFNQWDESLRNYGEIQ